MGRNRPWAVVGAALVAGLALIGIGAAVGHYLREPYNPGFRAYPLATAVHIIPGAVYLALAPLQLVAPIRGRWPGYHRWAGRVLVAIGLVVGATALFMAVAIPYWGWGERAVVAPFAAAYLVAIGAGYAHIRAGRVARHREWMLRALAIALAIATMRVLFIPALLFAGVDAEEEPAAPLATGSFAIAFLLNSAVAEAWIRRTRRRPVAVGGERRPAAGAGRP